MSSVDDTLYDETFQNVSFYDTKKAEKKTT
jgi:hypothetical protein